MFTTVIQGKTAYVRLVNDETYWLITTERNPPGRQWFSKMSATWTKACYEGNVGFDTEEEAIAFATLHSDAPPAPPGKPRYHVPMW